MKIIAIASYNLKKFDGVGNSCYSQYRFFENKFGSRYKVLMASESTDYPFVINYQTLTRLSLSNEVYLIYHHSIYDPYFAYLQEGRFKKFFIYFHGITPPELVDHSPTALQCSKGIEQISSLDFNRLSGLISNSFASLNQIQNIPYSTRRIIVPPIIFNQSNKFRSSYFHDNSDSEGKKKYKIFFLGRANASHKN
ncbi:hypothetical protein OAX96_03445, partial [Prochlorococcus sp. AH-736-K15]|nr:hypothetical protein [Prochlorococcus sp. AH-736-K15]